MGGLHRALPGAGDVANGFEVAHPRERPDLVALGDGHPRPRRRQDRGDGMGAAVEETRISLVGRRIARVRIVSDHVVHAPSDAVHPRHQHRVSFGSRLAGEDPDPALRRVGVKRVDVGRRDARALRKRDPADPGDRHHAGRLEEHRGQAVHVRRDVPRSDRAVVDEIPRREARREGGEVDAPAEPTGLVGVYREQVRLVRRFEEPARPGEGMDAVEAVELARLGAHLPEGEVAAGALHRGVGARELDAPGAAEGRLHGPGADAVATRQLAALEVVAPRQRELATGEPRQAPAITGAGTRRHFLDGAEGARGDGGERAAVRRRYVGVGGGGIGGRRVRPRHVGVGPCGVGRGVAPAGVRRRRLTAVTARVMSAATGGNQQQEERQAMRVRSHLSLLFDASSPAG